MAPPTAGRDPEVGSANAGDAELHPPAGADVEPDGPVGGEIGGDVAEIDRWADQGDQREVAGVPEVEAAAVDKVGGTPKQRRIEIARVGGLEMAHLVGEVMAGVGARCGHVGARRAPLLPG